METKITIRMESPYEKDVLSDIIAAVPLKKTASSIPAKINSRTCMASTKRIRIPNNNTISPIVNSTFCENVSRLKIFL